MNHSENPHAARDDRRAFEPAGRPTIAGVPVRDDDLEPTTRGLHSVAILFRVLAGLLAVIIVLQIINGLTATVEISYGVLIAEVIRLVIFAGLLWGAGDLADLFVTSHHDIRATRILLARLRHQIAHAADPSAGARGDEGPRPGDATH